MTILDITSSVRGSSLTHTSTLVGFSAIWFWEESWGQLGLVQCIVTSFMGTRAPVSLHQPNEKLILSKI